MRELLFRGKSIENGEWIIGGFYQEPHDDVKNGDSYIITKNLECTGIAHAVDKETVGQYTGLNDKNGKKIFEGDIVTVTDSNFPHGKSG